LIIGLIGGWITCIVFVIISLIRTSNDTQENLCHSSHVWIFMVTHLVFNFLIYKYSSIIRSKRDAETGGDANTADHELKSDGNVESSGNMFFIQGILQSGMTAWAIYEYWGVSCVHELHGKLLYLMFQIFVYLDIAATGIFVWLILLNCCLLCFCKRKTITNGSRESEIILLRNAVGGNDNNDNHNTKQTDKRVVWNV
jgi:hypothetical protein